MLSGELITSILLVTVTAVAIWAAVVDFLYMRIPNAVHVVLAAVFLVLVLPSIPWSESLARLGVGLFLFVVAFGLYTKNLMGAGDVKYIAISALFIPAGVETVLAWLLIITMSGLPVFLVHRMIRSVASETSFPSFSETGYFPYGPAISMGLVIVLFLSMAAA